MTTDIWLFYGIGLMTLVLVVPICVYRVVRVARYAWRKADWQFDKDHNKEGSRNEQKERP